MLPFVFIFIVLLGKSNCKIDFCDENQLPLTNPLQFTKELSVWEYAVDSNFKSLHCCARGYLSIEWFKDGKPYPWPSYVSSFIIYPESANQTVYTQTLTSSDAGNYTCRIHNDTVHMMHNTELKVFDCSGYMETPLPTYSLPEISTVVIGEEARLYCEAFVGNIDLPDATSEVTWSKEGNDTLDSPRVSVKKVQRENGQIVGEYLIIDNVNWSDFGTYVCTISNTGDQKIVLKTELTAWSDWPPPLCLGSKMTFFLCGFTVIFVLLFVIYHLIRYYMKLDYPLAPIWLKIVEMRSRVLVGNKKPKSNTLVLIYGDGDQEFVDNIFLPLLNRQSSLYIIPQKVTNQGKITEDMRDICCKTEKTVILMSRQLTENWTRAGIENVVDELISSNNSSYCVVLLESLPESLSDDGGGYLRRQQCKIILTVWGEEMSKNGHLFWNTNMGKNTTQAQAGLRLGLSSSDVITTSSPVRYSFMRLTRPSQPTEVPV